MGPLIPVILEQELVPFSVFSPAKDHVPALGQLTIARTGICRANEAVTQCGWKGQLQAASLNKHGFYYVFVSQFKSQF